MHPTYATAVFKEVKHSLFHWPSKQKHKLTDEELSDRRQWCLYHFGPQGVPQSTKKLLNAT